MIRKHIDGPVTLTEIPLFISSLTTFFYWVIVFALFGLYHISYGQSRIDEVLTVFRATVTGVLILFFLNAPGAPPLQAGPHSRFFILGYWVILVAFVTIGRQALRNVQRRLLVAGIGLKNTLIIGWSDKAFELCDMVQRNPSLGDKIVGFIKMEQKKGVSQSRPESYHGIPVIGYLDQISDIITEKQIRSVLIGLDSSHHKALMEIIHRCDFPNVQIRIMPDLYNIVSGQARISSIYGLPLMEVHPELLKTWESFAKRSLDLISSLSVVLLTLPLWIIIAVIIKLNSRGPILYKQIRVGKDGKHFKMFKFRSMRTDAEKHTGPVWAGKNDPRVTKVGRFLRKTHLDEMPQFLNVIKGDMSLVGPRPERPFFVEKLSKEIPLYKHRHRVKPGITGWAQVKYKYDENIEDVRNKIKYDLFYIENNSWRLDIKILFNTVYVMVAGKGHT
jgi:exopolysaccharide biosynthesis polyprenyl glycosylphosphotransferase